MIAGAAAAALWLAAPLAAQTRYGAETGATVGSREYYGMNVSLDGSWIHKDLTPYARMDVMADSFQRAATIAGGAWRKLNGGVSLRAGMALTGGKALSAARPGRSISLEAAAEKTLGKPTLGVEYRMTSGSIVTSAFGRGAQGRLSRSGGGGYGDDSFTVQEVSLFGRLPAGPMSLGARVTGYFTSNGSSALSETLSISWTIAESLSGSLAATFDDESIASYISAGLRCRF